MADTPTRTRKQNLAAEFDRTARNVGAAMQANRFTNKGGAAIPGMMAFMGMPNQAPQRGWGAGGMGGFGDFQFGGGKGGKGNGDGGDNPGGDPNPDPNDPSKLGYLGKAYGFPQWYIDWYNSQGVYGGVPPVQGLL